MATPIGTPMTHPNRSSECYGRTDGPTKKPITHESHPTAVDADARADIPSIGDVIEAGRLWMTDERHPVIRTGERAEIPPHVRAAVWYRDRGKCELCNAPTPTDQPWHLDHITPWSAGGSDDTTNLRVLCERHNMERGNRIDPTERPRRAATWWCINCYDLDNFRWTYDGIVTHCGIHNLDITNPNPWRCRVIRAYRKVWLENGSVPIWHQTNPVSDADTIAYCAHCNAPALTDRPL